MQKATGPGHCELFTWSTLFQLIQVSRDFNALFQPLLYTHFLPSADHAVEVVAKLERHGWNAETGHGVNYVEFSHPRAHDSFRIAWSTGDPDRTRVAHFWSQCVFRQLEKEIQASYLPFSFSLNIIRGNSWQYHHTIHMVRHNMTGFRFSFDGEDWEDVIELVAPLMFIYCAFRCEVTLSMPIAWLSTGSHLFGFNRDLKDSRQMYFSFDDFYIALSSNRHYKKLYQTLDLDHAKIEHLPPRHFFDCFLKTPGLASQLEWCGNIGYSIALYHPEQYEIDYQTHVFEVWHREGLLDISALQAAIMVEKLELVEFLLDQGCDPNFCPQKHTFVIALESENMDIMRLLFKHGLKIESPEHVHVLIRIGVADLLPVLDYFVDQEVDMYVWWHGDNPFHTLVRNYMYPFTYPCFEFLMGHLPNRFLHDQMFWEGVLDVLIDTSVGVEVNQDIPRMLERLLEIPGFVAAIGEGHPCLYELANSAFKIETKLHIANLLIGAGATAKDCREWSMEPALMKLYLKHGYEPFAPNVHGDIPIFMSMLYGPHDTWELMVEHIDINTKSHTGYTVLSYLVKAILRKIPICDSDDMDHWLAKARRMMSLGADSNVTNPATGDTLQQWVARAIEGERKRAKPCNSWCSSRSALEIMRELYDILI